MGWWTRVRQWAIGRLAGKMQLAVNLTFDEPVVVVSRGTPLLVQGCVLRTDGKRSAMLVLQPDKPELRGRRRGFYRAMSEAYEAKRRADLVPIVERVVDHGGPPDGKADDAPKFRAAADAVLRRQRAAEK